MAEDFGTLLSTKIKSYDQFWRDLGSLQSAAVWSLSVGEESSKSPAQFSDPAALSRLMYSASVFAQAADEETRGLAQAIALCALITNPEPNLIERSKSILATIGNYPALSYLENQFNETSSTLFADFGLTCLRR